MVAKSNKIKKNAVIKKMRATLGNVTESCKAADIARKTYYEWYNNDPDFRDAIDAIAESCIDYAESSLMQQIKDGNPTSTIFYLKTKGRKRGYVEKIETEQRIESVVTFDDKKRHLDELIEQLKDE